MPDNTHRIMRQILELDFGPTDQFVELQQVAARILQNQGSTTMETVFNHLTESDQWIRLERLELDLGVLRGTDWPAQLNQRLAEQLEYSLADALNKQSAPSVTTSTPTTDRQFEQFLYFCQWGRLPWWSSQAATVWPNQLSTTLTSAQWNLLIDHVQRDRQIRQRLIYTVDDDFLQTLLQRFDRLPAAAHVQQQLSIATWSPATQAHWRERFWSILLTHSPVSTVTAGSDLMRQLLATRQQLLATNPTVHPETMTERPRNRPQALILTDLPSLPAPWQSWLLHIVQASDIALSSTAESSLTNDTALAADTDSREFSNSEALDFDQPSIVVRDSPSTHSSPQDDDTPADGTTIITPNLPGPQPEQTELASPLSLTNNPEISSFVLPETDRDWNVPALEEMSPHTWSVPEAVKEVYVDAVGMIILHPFLQELFNSLELLNNRQFRNVFSQRRAVALLTYLTFGEISVQEYELLLPKLLVHWPWTVPLPPYDLTEAERQACDQLMAAVLRHWSALRSSSAQWLRETFFWRDGKLTPVDGGWQLTIERHAQDILLNRLPWGLGVIRLPWMTDFLYVSWIN